MKKVFLISIFFSAILLVCKTKYMSAQEVTVPDYAYGSVYSEYGSVTQSGVADPGPYGGYSTGEDERSSAVFLAHGYRWWGYPSYVLLMCGDFPFFNYPGFHGVWDMSSLGCANPPIGFKASWGGVISDPPSNTIWCLTGAVNENGPTAPYCIPNPFGSGQICYPAPSAWGYGSSYGYLRKVVTVRSTGSLQTGDPVQIKASLSSHRSYDGDGTISGMGVLFLNYLSGTPWLQEGMGREYLRWGDVQDILGTPSILESLLANLIVDVNNTDETTINVAVGDILNVEIAFNNSVQQNSSPGSEAAGWAGQEPSVIFGNINYTRTDSVKNIIKNYGNSLTYDLISLTAGVVLEPVTSDGPNADEDKDGISDTMEKGPDGNNSTYDGNSDAIPDWEQSNVASFLTYDGQHYVTLVVPSGKELSQLIVTGNPSPSDTPEDASFPFGFFDFSIDGLTPGEALTVTLILHDDITVEKYYKYGFTPDNPTSHWYEFNYDGQTGAEINASVITLHFVDGLRGDEDITANGSIKEPGGPVISGTTGFQSLNETIREILVYPNPASDYIRLKLYNIVPSDNYILRISSISGEIMLEKTIDVKDPHQEIILPVDYLPGGMYLITLSGNINTFKSKFIKLK
jgi:hypothetical protein